jgi:putative sterol carrier protein
MEAKTPAEFFDKALPKRFDPSKAEGFDATIQMNITGSKGGEWTVTIKDGKLETKKGTYSNPSMTITVADSDFLDLVNGKVSGERAFVSGRLKFEGNLSVALKILQSGLL